MSEFDSVKSRQCESNKKISFSQKSSIETKSAIKGQKFDYMGQSFSVSANEVIESALFDRVTRNCSGEIIRSVSVRRLRKVGLDEWFSILAGIGNDIWDKDFKESSPEDAIVQGVKNLNKMDLEKRSEYQSPPKVSTATSFQITDGVKNTEKKVSLEEESKKKKQIITIMVISVAVFGIYKYYNSKK